MGIVDIHSHILPGVDDGAESMEMALEMLERGIGEGIGGAVLTPHLKPEHDVRQEERHRERFEELRERVRRAGLPIELYLGSEIGFRFGMVEVARWPSGSLAQGGRYVLVDLPGGPLSPGLEQGFFELRAAGYRPILAHPERHGQLVRSFDRIARLRRQEVLIQIDVGSVIGRFGRRAARASEWMLRRGWVEFVASDAHDLERRPFSLSEGRMQIASWVGREEADRLLVENPTRLLRGEEVVRQRTGSGEGKRGIFRRIFGRMEGR